MPRFTAESDAPLIDFLKEHLQGWKTSTIKQRLKNGLVGVNGKTVRSGATMIHAGEMIEVLAVPESPSAHLPPGLGRSPLDILYADDHILAVDKPSGLLSVASERERDMTAIHLMRGWLAGIDGGGGTGRELHAAHRLDRDASGVLLFARSLDIKRRLAAAWHTYEKIYAAVVDGCPSDEEGTIDAPLWEDKALFVRVAEKGRGESAITHYRLEKRLGHRSLLEVRLGTGRKHQIRVHLAHLGCPIVGDLRYGVSKASRLALHARSLRIYHPEDGREITIEAKLPHLFLRMLSGGGRN